MFQKLLLLMGVLLITGWHGEIASAETETKIYGGSPAKQGQYRYQVLIRHRGVFICGGSILNREAILTAASCISEAKHPNVYAIVVGEMNRNVVEGTEQVYVPNAIILKDGYDPVTHDADLAVIKLQEHMEYNSNVNNIRLPESGATWYYGKTATVTGWGDESQYVLQFDSEGQVLPMDQQQNCDPQIPSINMICAKSKACLLDLGGPLVVSTGDGTLVQVGIASVIQNCSKPPIQGSFTKVGEYTSWIESQAGSIDKGAGHVTKLSVLLMVLTVAIALFT